MNPISNQSVISMMFDIARAAGVTPAKLLKTIKDKKGGEKYAEEMARSMMELVIDKMKEEGKK